MLLSRLLVRVTLFAIFITQDLSALEKCSYSEEFRFADSEGDEIILRHVKNKCEIWGLKVDKKATVQMWSTGEKLSVFPVGQDSVINGYKISKGAYVNWHKNGPLRYLSHFANTTEISNGVWTNSHTNHAIAAVYWDKEGTVRWVQILGKEITNSTGEILGRKCQSAWFDKFGNVVRTGDLYVGC